MILYNPATVLYNKSVRDYRYTRKSKSNTLLNKGSDN